MNISYHSLDTAKGTFQISLDIADVEQEEKKVVLNYNNSLSVDGFRKGKIPRSVIEQQIGKLHLLEEAVERAIPRILDQATKEHGVDIYGQPDIKVTKITETGPIELEVTFTKLPMVKLTTYTGLAFTRKEVTADSKDVDRSLEELRNLAATEKKVDRPSQKGDKITVDFEGFLDQIPLEGGKATNHPIHLGESGNMFVPGFEDSLLGLKAGEEKEFTIRFPKDYGRKQLADRDVQFKAKVHHVHEVTKPELSDELAKKMGGFTTLNELREQLQKNITEDLKQKEEQRFELELIQQLLKKNSFDPLPDQMIEDELERILHEIKHSVEHQGGTFEDYLSSIKKTEEDIKKEYRPRAQERVQTALLLRAIAEKEKLFARENEVDAIVEQEKNAHKDKPEVLKQIASPAYRRHIANVLTSRSVLQYLKEHNTKK